MLPLGTGIVVTIFIKVFIERRAPRYNHYVLVGGVLLFAGFVFFSLGLDDKKDWLRMRHSLWHCCVGLSTAFFVDCIVPSPPGQRYKRKKNYLAGQEHVTNGNPDGYLRVKMA